MPMCHKCNAKFPNQATVDGKVRNLQRRKFCLSCSPFGLHNTRDISQDKVPFTAGVSNTFSTVGPVTPIMTSSSDLVSGIGEIAAAHHFAKAGYLVSKPLFEKSPYDLLVDDGQVVRRVDVKTTSPTKGTLPVSLRSVSMDLVDWLAAYDIENDKLYVVPVNELSSSTQVMLRVEPPKNGQRAGLNIVQPIGVGAVPARPDRCGKMP